MSFSSSIEYSYPPQYRWEAEKDAFQQAKGALWGADGQPDFFGELIDIVNPLQQLPIISSFYRQATQDAISPFARMVGGFLLGGPLGMALAAANNVIEGATGGDLGEHFFALFNGDSETPVAQAAGRYAKAQRLTG